ncbi:MAG: MFS transporter [Clostridia bacterium]|nr:MFS transporter [Clostridia bacterium]
MISVVFDWKSVVALGMAVASIILVSKLDSAAAERVSTRTVDACKEYAIAVKSIR